MRLYSIYTPSHKVFLKRWFLPTIRDDYELIMKQCPQECPKGLFMKNGWMKTLHRKIDLIINAIHNNWNDIFVFSDVDIQFFGKTKELILDSIKNFDFIAQKDANDSLNAEIVPDMSGHLCAGFFACKGNERTLRLWEEVKKYCLEKPHRHDQHGLNHYLNGFSAHKKDNLFGVTWDYLPPEFYSPGSYLGTGIWSSGKKLEIPENIVMHHANWTQGIRNKIAQLKYIKRTVGKRR